jgi:gamma-glutamyltranspeptidase / glutathione hydrolase
MNLLRTLIPGMAALALAGCETARSVVGAPSGFVRGFLGGVAAEEPSAAAVARAVLSSGGTAADAAAAAGFALTVSLPSRAGLGGGGACLIYHPRREAPEALVFMPGAREGGLGNADRPAAVPLMARGLFALTTRMQGARPFEETIIPAERLARFGVPMSRALAADLAAVGGPLLADPNVRAVFTRADGSVVPVGESFTSQALAGTLTSLRSLGVGDLYQGALGRRLVEAVPLGGGGALSLAELRAALPAVRDPIIEVASGGDRVAFLPLDGGLAAAAAFRALRAGQSEGDAQERGLSVGRAARSGVGTDAAALLAQSNLPGGSFGGLPASTGLTVFDREGGAVTCVFTMNNLFGTGRHAPGTGVLLAAAPNTGSVQPPLPAAAIAFNSNLRAFRMAVAGSGQQAAPMAVAGPLAASLLRGVGPGDAAGAGPAPGRTQLGACPRYLPGRPAECLAVSDPRGFGVALGAVE